MDSGFLNNIHKSVYCFVFISVSVVLLDCMSQLNWKHEWHLYSAVFATSALTFISVSMANGIMGVTDATLSVAFSAIVGMFMFASKSWRESPREMHEWIVILSIVLILLTSFILWTSNKK